MSAPAKSGPRPGWRLGTVLFVLLLAAGVAAYVLTAGSVSSATATSVDASLLGPQIDAALRRDVQVYRTSMALTPLADGAAERADAAQAAHLGDEILDATFAVAMQRVAALAPPANTSAADQAATQRIHAAQAAVNADQSEVARLQAAMKIRHASAASLQSLADQLSIAQAQLGLDQDRLQDAITDSKRVTANGGLQGLVDEQSRIEAAAVQQQTPTASSRADAADRNPASARGWIGEIHAAWLMHAKVRTIAAAAAIAAAARPQVLAEHNRVEQTAARDAKSPGAGALAAIQRQQRLQQQLSRLDSELDNLTALATVYARWLQSAQAQQRAVLHAVASGALILLLIFGLLRLVLRSIRRVQRMRRWDRNRQATLGHILSVVVETIAVVSALILMFGRPSQLATTIGIVGAGLTVAFEDTLLSLAGWFVLMGRNGIRLGDYVEINGVMGEVVEIRLLQTTLIELGSWATTGLPTGRRVFFPNNFAVTGAYFNFSTSGQWMWDQLELPLPAQVEPEAALAAVTAAVERETAPLRQHAPREVPDGHTGAAAETPQALLRPTAGGWVLVVRYLIPARERANVREKLWRAGADALAAKPLAAPATPDA